MRRELTYAGKPLSEFGVWVDNSKIYRKPMKRYTGYDIPARNGTLYQSDKKYDNVTMEFNCYIKKDFDTNFSNLVNYLNSFDTYQKLENSHNPNMFRLALFHEAVEVEAGQFLKDGQFRLYFDCKPQEFYKSGETFQAIQRSSSTVTGNPVTVENPSGLTALTGLNVDIQPVQDLNGYDSPWVGGAGKNKYPIAIGKELFGNNVNATHTTDNDVLTVSCTANNDSGVYAASKSELRQLSVASTGTYTWSADIKCDKNAPIMIGYQNKTRLTVSVTTQWQRVSVTDTYDGNPAAFTIYNKSGEAVSVQVKNFAFVEGTDSAYYPYSNICPITGHTQALVTRYQDNLFDGETITEGYYNTGGVWVSNSNIVGAKNLIRVQGGERLYIVSLDKVIQITAFSEYVKIGEDGSEAYISRQGRQNQVYNVPSNAKYLYFNFPSSYGSTYKNDLSINTDPNDTELHEPAQTVTVDLNGTRYGGTLNVLTGMLTVTHQFVELGSLTWGKNGSYGEYMARYAVNNIPVGNASDTNVAGDIVCSCFKALPTARTYRGYETGIGIAEQYLSVGNTANPSLADFVTSINGQTCAYEIAEPQTVQLTAQQVSLLTGTNVISTDMENTEVTISEPFMLENPSYMKAKPVFKVKVPSKVSINGEQVIDAFGMIDWAETPITHGELTWQVFDGYVRIQGTQSTDFERYIAYLTVPPGTYSIKLNGGDYRSLVQLKIDDGTTETSAFINTDYTFTATEKTEYVLSIFIQSYTQVNDDFTLTLGGQTEYMYINSELMDAYYEDGKNANPYVELTDGYIELPSGETYITVEGEAEIMPNWWRL